MADFNEGLFGCFDDLVGCIVDAYICGACSSAKQHATLDGQECDVMYLLKHWCCFPCCNYTTRQLIREKYGYQEAGSCITDCFLGSCICGVCGVAQQIREMNAKGDTPCQMLMGK